MLVCLCPCLCMVFLTVALLQLLESLRQEMLSNESFASVPVDKRSPEAVKAYLQQVQDRMDARVQLSALFHKQIAHFHRRMSEDSTAAI